MSVDELYTNPSYARLTPANFALYCSGGKWHMAKHLALLNRKLVDVAAGRTKRLMISMPPRPQPLYSKVLMADGTYKPIGNIEIGELVMSHNGVPRKVVDVINAGIQPIIRFLTAKGIPIDVAETHPLMVENKGWIEAKEITTSDKIYSIYNINAINKNEELTLDQAYLLGFFTANGKPTKEKPYYSRIPIEKLNPRYCVEGLFLKSDKYLAASKSGEEFLNSIEFNFKAVHKLCYTLSDENVIPFICGVFATRRLESITDKIQIIIRDSILENLILVLEHYGIRVEASRTERAISFFLRDRQSLHYVTEMLHGRIDKRRDEEFFRLPHKVQGIQIMPDSPCVCLTVEEDHSYVSEGYCTHNSGKSELVSKYFPAWYLGTFPDNKVIFATYEAHFAAEFGAASRDLLIEHGLDVFGVKIKEGGGAASRWKIEDNLAIMQCAGVGGPMTGKGADCIGGEIPISTTLGPIPIEKLVEMVNKPSVLSYNHLTNSLEYRKIIATKTTKSEELYEIITDSGNKIRATGKHRFFVGKRGYREAELLTIGDILYEEVPIQQNLQKLQPAQGRSGNYLSRLLQQNKKSRRISRMRTLRKSVREKIIRIRETIKKKSRRSFLLLKKMFSNTPFFQKCKTLQILSGTHARLPEQHVLLQRMWSEKSVKWGYKTQISSTPFEIQPLVLQNASINSGTRSKLLSELQKTRTIYISYSKKEKYVSIKSRHTSYRRGQGEQYSGKFDNSMYKLSCQSPQIVEHRVREINKISTESVPVYDIQVEGNSNFFANGILVHNCLIIDDPIKNDTEAESTLMRDKIFKWFGATSYTRLQPNGAIIIVMTRWHNDDIMGRLIENMKQGTGEHWEYLKFPAIANENEKPWPEGLGRQIGEALWPEMWPIEALLKIKNSGALSSYYWSSLYQQEPAPEGGGIFKEKWFRYYTMQGNYYILEKGDGITEYIEDNKCWKFMTVDTANKVKNTSDYTAIGVWTVTPNHDLILCHLVRARLGYEEIMKKLIALHTFHKTRYIGIENMGIAIQLIIEARNKGLPVRELEPEGKGKQNRANMPMGAVIRMENGKIFFPKHADYLADVEIELMTFPKAAHDEIVDILSYACNELTKIDMYDNDDFLPYIFEDALPVGMRKKGGILF